MVGRLESHAGGSRVMHCIPRRADFLCAAIVCLYGCSADTAGRSGRPAVVEAGAAGTVPVVAPAAGTTGGVAPTPVGGSAGAAGMLAPSQDTGAGSAGTIRTPAPGDASFHRDIRPIIGARCLGCHVDGGSGPFPLDTWAAVEPVATLVVDAVMARRMPPWLADATDCTKIRHDQRLTDAQLALFSDWQASGFPPGDEAEFVPLAEPPIPAIGEPDLVVKASTPHRLTAGSEYYACEQVGSRVAEDLWVTAMDIVPENDEYVHHAIVSVGNGRCSALGTTAENVYSYRPGSRTLVFEEGDALLIPAGSIIAVQFHYNTRFAPRGTTLPTDSSAFRMWTLPPGEKPVRAIVRMPHHDLFINIPVGAVDQREGGRASIGSEYTRPGAEIIGISPHMHYLGQRFKETLHKADGTDVCLVEIPAWDQDWQLDYFFEPSSFIPVARGAAVTQECYFSNRAEDQGADPDGNPFAPRYTTFGEDTRQEMCLGYIWFRYPLSGT
jgi:hypothetical protein